MVNTKIVVTDTRVVLSRKMSNINSTNGGSGANGCNTRGKRCVGRAAALAAAPHRVIQALAIVIMAAETATAGADLAIAVSMATVITKKEKTAVKVKWRR